MSISKSFCLSGLAYLEDIILDKGKRIVQLTAIHPSSQDEVYLDCEVEGVCEMYLSYLLTEVKRGNSVIVSFQATYHHFKVAFSCADSHYEMNDDQIVKLSGKLFEIGNCYINGSLVDKSHFRFLKAA
jgi:hypothetical protein